MALFAPSRELDRSRGCDVRRSRHASEAGSHRSRSGLYPRWANARLFGFAMLVLSLLFGCNEPPKGQKLPPSAETTAELRVVRRGVTVEHRGEASRAPFVVERIGEGALVKLEAGSLAWVRRDGGARVLLKGPGTLTLDGGLLSIADGKMFVEVPEGISETVRVGGLDLTLASVKASIETSAAKTEAYVLAGEVRVGAAVARAGESLKVDPKAPESASVVPTVSWEDWTGGLATTDPAAAPPPFGVGTVGARTPGSSGAPRLALTIQRLDVRVRVVGDLAITEVDQVFFNPQSTTVEGLYLFRTPENAVLERFGVDRDGGILYGYVKEKKSAEAQYQSNVYQGSKEDPALLAYRAPGEYEARLYPIGPGATRRVVVQYTEWLARSGAEGERRLYTYPMAFEGALEAAPTIEDLSIEVDLSRAGAKSVKSGDGAVKAGETIVVRKHDLIPRADFALELFDAGMKQAHAVRATHSVDKVVLGAAEAADARRNGQGEADYLLVPIRSQDWAPEEPGLDVVIVVDTSAATDASMLRMARATTRALLTHLGENDRALVLAGDDRVRPVADGAELTKVDAASRRAMIEGLAKVEVGGATDLAAMLAQAASKVGDKRRSAIVYLGDGAATVGEVDLTSLRDRLKKAPRAVRTFGLGMGDTANLGTLAGLSTGGFAARVTDEETAARTALRVLERAERSVALGASVNLGANVERVYPRDLGAVTEGESVFVVGRITGESPSEVTLTTALKTTTLPISVQTLEDQGDLRRRWAMGRLSELIETAAGQAALVDLGVRQGIITPVTSIYVPTSSEMTSEQKRSIDRRERPRKALKLDETGGRDEQENDKKTSDSDRRAKGEEGSMGKGAKAESAAAPAATAAASAAPASGRLFGVEGPGDDGKADAENQRKEGGSGRRPNAETDGAAANEPSDTPNGVPQSAATAAAPPPPPAAPVAKPGLSDKLEEKPMEAPTGGNGIGQGGGTGRLAAASASPKVPAPEANKDAFASRTAVTGASLRSESEQFGMIGLLDQNDPWGDGRRHQHVVLIDDPGRLVRLCGDGSKLAFEERKALWRERLAGTGARPEAVLQIFKQAQALCEAPTMRERRALLLMSLEFLPTVQARVTLYRLLAKDVPSADVVYRGILARITTSEQVRQLNQALGVLTVDPLTLEKTLAEAKDAKDRANKLRLLAAKFPDDTALLLLLLEAFEDAEEFSSARALARDLRKRSDADARLRTAVGELHLRLAKRAAKDELNDDESEARRAFGEIVEFAADDPVARRRLGDLYRAHGYYAEATRQYETLARLVPDEPTVAVLMALSQNGLGKLEEAVRWTEKGQKAGAPDVAQGPHATARAFAGLFLAWGRVEAKKAGRNDELKTLLARTGKLLGNTKTEGRVRVVLSWSHPELHPSLFTNALGTMTPAIEGDISLGLTQAVLSAQGAVEVRLEPAELAKAARLGAKATLTTIFAEGTDAETISVNEISFNKEGPATQRFKLAGGTVEVGQ